MISCGDYACHDDSINKAASRCRTGHLEYDGERGSPGLFTIQPLGSIRDVETQNKDGKDIEEQYSPEDIAHDFWDCSCWVFGFTCGNCDGFGSSIYSFSATVPNVRIDHIPTCKRGCHKDRSKPSNTTNKGSVADEPIVTANIPMLSICATIDGNTKDDEDLRVSRICKTKNKDTTYDDGYDLEQAEPIFKLAQLL